MPVDPEKKKADREDMKKNAKALKDSTLRVLDDLSVEFNEKMEQVFQDIKKKGNDSGIDIEKIGEDFRVAGNDIYNALSGLTKKLSEHLANGSTRTSSETPSDKEPKSNKEKQEKDTKNSNEQNSPPKP